MKNATTTSKPADKYTSATACAVFDPMRGEWRTGDRRATQSEISDALNARARESERNRKR